MFNHTAAVSPANVPRRKKVWLGANEKTIVPVVVPAKTKVRWEAYVIDTQSSQGVDNYPRLDGTNEWIINGTERPSNEMRAAYIDKVKDQVDEAAYQELVSNTDSGVWTVATIVNSLAKL